MSQTEMMSDAEEETPMLNHAPPGKYPEQAAIALQCVLVYL